MKNMRKILNMIAEAQRPTKLTKGILSNNILKTPSKSSEFDVKKIRAASTKEQVQLSTLDSATGEPMTELLNIPFTKEAILQYIEYSLFKEHAPDPDEFADPEYGEMVDSETGECIVDSKFWEKNGELHFKINTKQYYFGDVVITGVAKRIEPMARKTTASSSSRLH